jgi:ribose transport system substrate-binding protein
VDGVFAVCEPNSTGMLGALEQAGLAGRVKFIAFDPNAALVQAMRDGKIHGIVLQDPVKMGYLAVKTMVEHLQGKPVEKRIATGEYMATPENMSGEEMHRLLHPQQYE